MSSMINVYSIKSKYTKQEEIFKKIDASLEKALAVLEKFNGKVINVKIENAIKEAVHDRDLFIIVSHFTRDLVISDPLNRTYQKYNDDGEKEPYDRGIIDYYEERVVLSSGDRVDYIMCRRDIEDILNRHKKIIEKEKQWLAQSDSMIKEYKELLNNFEAFNKKYDYSLRNDCGCTFGAIY